MARPKSAPDLHLLGKVGTLYYLQDQTQQQIADRLGLSRPTVSRLLREARDQGIVRITVSPPAGTHRALEGELERHFGLAEVRVVATEPRPSDDTIRWHLGEAAAAYLERVVQAGQSIGLAWGSTLSAMVDAVAPSALRDVHVVQMLGGIGPPASEAYAAGVARRLAEALDASAVLLPAPGVVATPAVRDALRKDRHVGAALRHFDEIDVAFVGIGSIASNAVLRDHTVLPASVRASVVAAGAVGDIALRFFDVSGAAVRTTLDDRILGISVEQLRRIPRVVAVAGGSAKTDAIRAALATGIVDVLITDQTTAGALLHPPKRAARSS